MPSAAQFILGLHEAYQDRNSWKRTTQLLMAAAERGGSIEAATEQFEDRCGGGAHRQRRRGQHHAGDAAKYIVALSEDRRRAHWDRTAPLLLDLADSSEISRQLELALFYDRQLNLKTPPR